MAGFNKVDDKVHQERVHEVSLLLKRKPVKYILQYISETWKIDERQARNYIRQAKAEWKKYFSQVKKCGMAYHVTQLRELKDQAFGRAVVVGRGENKAVVEVPDLNLVLDITKEEAKLMGIYPSEKHDVKVEGELKIIDAKRKLVSKIASLASRAREGKNTK